jgi:hypothetical protein
VGKRLGWRSLGGVSRIDGGGTRVTSFGTTRVVGWADVYPPNPRDFFSDRPDRLWVAALDGIRACTLPAFHCTRDESPATKLELEVHPLHADAQGRLWAGVRNGVLRFDDGEWRHVAGWPLSGTQVRALVNTPDGALWMATGGGGIVRHKDDRFAQVSVADGLPSDVVRALDVALGSLALGEDPTVPLGWARFNGKATYAKWDAAAGTYVTVGNQSFAVYGEDRNNPGTGIDRIWLGGPGTLAMPGTLATAKNNTAQLTGGGWRSRTVREALVIVRRDSRVIDGN